MQRHLPNAPYSFSILSFIYLFLPLTLFAQEGEENVEKLVDQALEAGNASKVAQHFTKKVDLSLPGTDDLFSKAQAEQILKEFFQKHPPEELVLEHRGTSRLKDRYRIAKLRTEKGEYRLTYFMKKMEAGPRIKKLRIEPYEGDP